MISREEITQDNNQRLARWIQLGGRDHERPAPDKKTRARALRHARAKLLEEMVRLTDELQEMGEE